MAPLDLGFDAHSLIAILSRRRTRRNGLLVVSPVEAGWNGPAYGLFRWLEGQTRARLTR